MTSAQINHVVPLNVLTIKIPHWIVDNNQLSERKMIRHFLYIYKL